MNTMRSKGSNEKDEADRIWSYDRNMVFSTTLIQCNLQNPNQDTSAISLLNIRRILLLHCEIILKALNTMSRSTLSLKHTSLKDYAIGMEVQHCKKTMAMQRRRN